MSGVEMNPPVSESGIQYKESENSPNFSTAGNFPYRSGIYESMYVGKPWTMRQYSGFGSPSEANLRLKQLVSAGMTGLSIAFDLPTQMGLDPDDELSLGEVGKVGVSISCLEDMRNLFEGIDIENISTSMTINATAPILLLMYQVVAEERGIDPSKLKGTTQNDILKEYISRGTYIFPTKHSLNLTTELIRYCSKNLPNWNPISISGYHMAEAGATPVQEVAYTFANAIAYIEGLQGEYESVDDFASRLSFFFASRTALLEEIAKFRAAREVWARIMTERFGADKEKSKHLKFHTQTAGVQLIAQNPELNIVRVTLQALGAIFGGTQSLHTNSFDEAHALPTEESATIALRTQQIIFHETDIACAVDPFRGSYLIESMTDQFINAIFLELDRIEELGGAVSAIDAGYQLGNIEANAYKLANELESGNRKIAGLNYLVEATEQKMFSEPTDIQLEEIDHDLRMKKYRSSRNLPKVSEATNEIRLAAEQGDLMMALKRAIITGLTVGEICSALKDVWGKY
jgi:methylmalonyl-CoA mutase N-terminal domain/subunit